MPDPDTIRERSADGLERDALYLLTSPKEGQPMWSVEDLGREMDALSSVEDAVDGLLRSGLIYRTVDGFVFATRAGVRAVAMMGQTV